MHFAATVETVRSGFSPGEVPRGGYPQQHPQDGYDTHRQHQHWHRGVVLSLGSILTPRPRTQLPAALEIGFRIAIWELAKSK
jgi:hypothetical protein